jgi:hypothetical protein
MQGVQMAGMKRFPLVRTAGIARASVKLPKCAAPGCRVRFVKLKPNQVVCGEECALRLVESENAKAARKAEKQRKAAEKLERDTDKARREALKTIPQLIEEAQVDFNTFIRLRDNGRSCISCTATLRLGGVGGGFDCGHYRSRGAAGHLRFVENNAFGQCKRCNDYLSGNAVAMRLGAIQRIGLAAVEAVEQDNTPRKWTREGLRAIKAKYQAKAAELRKAANE